LESQYKVYVSITFVLARPHTWDHRAISRCS